jgi:uncharacterized membrane protein YhiD involved in acid resistance
MLVGLSSALFVGLGEVYVARQASEHVHVDPMRVLEAVGVAVGLGEYMIATGTTLMALVVLISATNMERHIARQKPQEMDSVREVEPARS